MPRHFTHYWSNDEFRDSRDTPVERFNYLYGNQFRRRGMQADDLLYPVTVLQGRLFLVGCVRVDRLCDEDEAAERLGCEIDDLAEADDFAFVAAGTPLRYDLEIPVDVVERLRFVSASGSLPLKFKEPGRLDEQTLRGVREPTPGSAALLDGFLPALAPW